MPILFFSLLSPFVCPHTSSPCLPLGQSEEPERKWQGIRQWRGHVSFLPLPGVFFPSHSTSGCIISIRTGGDSSANLFTLLFFCTNTVMERTERGRNRDSVHVIKTGPQGKQSRLYISSYFEKDLDWIYLSLKCKCQVLLERCITISKDPMPRNQHTTEKLQTY